MSLTRILASWAAVCVLMVANGALRELSLVADLGRRNADVASAALGMLIILGATRFLFRPLSGKSNAVLARVSALFVGLTIAFEFSFGHWVDHRSWEDLLANYAFWRGRLWPALLVILALTPWIWGRWAPYGSVARPEVRHAR